MSPSMVELYLLIYISIYLVLQGRVFELDGLKSGPYVVGECGEDWTKVAREAISKKMARLACSEILYAPARLFF
jgi:hypothetical protein